ncbi:MAG: hypothetical protein RLZZ308_352 [Candidatus Parcubacteria bacterium]|jgi:hypothetical protein
MGSTTQPLGADFPAQMVTMMLNAIQEGTINAAKILWGILITFLKAHWVGVGEILLSFLGVAFLVFLLTGRWAMLGSVLNRYFFFGILFLIGLIFGPEIFANDYFEIIWAVVGLIAFVIVRKIFKK